MSKEIEKYICKVAGISLSEFRKGNYTEKNTIARDNYIYYLRNQEKIRVGKIAEMMQKTSSSISKSLSRTKNNINSRIYPEIQIVIDILDRNNWFPALTNSRKSGKKKK